MVMDITCGIFLIRQDKKMLFCHPTSASWNQLSIPKGVKDPADEDFFAAAKRELKEETGLHLDRYDGELIEVPDFIHYKRGNKSLKAFIFKSTDQIEDPLICTTFFTLSNGVRMPEVDKYYWLNPYDLGKFSPHYTQKFVIDKFICHE